MNKAGIDVCTGMSGPRIEIISKYGDEPTEVLRIFTHFADPIPVVTVHADGSATYGPGANPNDAAEAFWRALVLCPAFKEIKLLELWKQEAKS